jgi:hypothetical protein
MNTDMAGPDARIEIIDDISLTLRLRHDFIYESRFTPTSVHLDVCRNNQTVTLYLQLMPNYEILISFEGIFYQTVTTDEALSLIEMLIEEHNGTF